MTNIERMLINATEGDEVRVALMRGNQLYDLDIETKADIKKKGNIYKATVTRREPSLDAVFVEYGSKRQGFLPLKEISSNYFSKQASGSENATVSQLIRDGQELLIQIDKEERGNKGAAVTTFITLAGCYLVLMPNSPNTGGISRRIEGDERDELKETLNALSLTSDMGVIIRTAGVGKSTEELQADLDMLCNQWRAINDAYQAELAPCLIHQEGDVIIRSIRDNLRKSISEIIIDDHVTYIKAKKYVEQVKPEFLSNIKLYNSPIPLFNYYQVESQIETAYKREVILPSGGALVIDRTEALVSIDINSAKATGGSDIEATAFNTNIEAADEIARQLRLRDLGGLVVIDFIDMSSAKNQREVENRLKDALKSDRARIQVGRISRFGLLEMSRQRLRLSLGESHQGVCPRCEGRGTVRNIKSSSLAIIRLIEEEALKEQTAEVQVQIPVEVATFIMNEKREFIINIEKRHKVSIVIVSNPYMQSPQYEINRIKIDNVSKNKKPSYSLIQQPEPVVPEDNRDQQPTIEPAIKSFSEQSFQPAAKKPGLIKRLINSLTPPKAKEEASEDLAAKPKTKPQHKSDKKPHHASQNKKPSQRPKPQNPAHKKKPAPQKFSNQNDAGKDKPEKQQNKKEPT
jgi:ribonuclease E